MAGRGEAKHGATRARALVLVAGPQPQMRKASAKSWSKAKEAEFLSVLAETCNVTRACAAADVGVTSAYRRKKENAAFRAAWGDALAVAYQRLELVLLERAFNGTEKLVKRRDGSEEPMREYSNQLAIALLKMHRDGAVEADIELPPEDIDELRERLARKLQRMRKRDAETGPPTE